MITVSLDNVSRDFGGGEGLRPTSLDVNRGETVVLLGPSGSGKSTLLKIVGGFERPDTGTVLLSGRDVTSLPPEDRSTVMVFQSHALWPHLTVFDNVAFGLRVRKQSRAQIRERVHEMLELARLKGYEKRHPRHLSGGQRQRVALARALAVEPEVLLLDEPLSALDARLRDELRDELRRLIATLGLTAIYVTHDHHDALGLADRVVVLNNGEVAQIGGVEEIYEQPVDAFVARFCGDAEILAGRPVGDDVVELIDGTQLAVRGGFAEAQAVAIRPEALELAPADGANTIPGVVASSRYHGGRVKVVVETAVGQLALETPSPGPGVGERVGVHLPAERLWRLRPTQAVPVAGGA